MNDCMDVAIVVEALAKRFGDVQALISVDFKVRAGELFGFLGPNGAGKTTTIKLLTGLARPDAGRIRLKDIDCTNNPRAAQHLIGVVPDESNLYPELSGFDNLCFCASLYGIGKSERSVRARELLEMFGLNEAASRKFGGYSKGMKRKLTIAAALIHRPEILFLDEPTTGIDVASARRLRKLIADINENGTTIFLTTHYIEEAERLCKRIAFIVSGKVVLVESVEALLQPSQERHLIQLACTNIGDSLPDGLASAFPDLEFSLQARNRIRIQSLQPLALGPIVRFFEERRMEIFEAKRISPTLEDVFVEVTGIEADLMMKEKDRDKSGGAQ